MAVLTAVPNPEGVALLQQGLYSEIASFSLVDDVGSVYFTDTVHAVYFDNNGVLTVSALIPVDVHFTNWNKFIRILSTTGAIIAEIETPAIQFVTGVGGEQTVKLTVSGVAGEVVFKKDLYMTAGEIEGLYMGAVEALTAKVFQLENLLIEQGIINV